MKSNERLEARRMRQEEGRSVKEIAKLISVSPGSVSRWVRDIVLTKEQEEVLDARNHRFNAQNNGAESRRDDALSTRKLSQEAGREEARRNDMLHAMGCMLYWAEGSKSRGQLGFCNTDPFMMRFFMCFLRHMKVEEDKIGVSVNCYTNNGIPLTDIESYWLRILELPLSCLRKSIVNNVPRSSKLKSKNRHVYGVCRVSISNTVLLQRIFGSIQEYAQFDNPQLLG